MPWMLPVSLVMRRVEVAVGIEPEDEEGFADVAAVARDAGDRAHRDRVVAAEEDRPGAGLEALVAGGARLAGEGVDLGLRGEPAVGAEVAAVLDEIAEVGEALGELGDAQGFGAHRRRRGARRRRRSRCR